MDQTVNDYKMTHKQKPKTGMNRREILRCGLYGSIAASLPAGLLMSCTNKQHKKDQRPNVILIVVDTLRADHVDCYGNKRTTTPHIDALAREGILFKNAISTAPWTLPSVASILTSQYPSVLGIREEYVKLDQRFTLLPEVLKNHDYSTYGVTSAPLVTSNIGFGRGYDDYNEEHLSGHESVSSPGVTEQSVSFVKKPHTKPFFLFSYYFDPHYNYILHKKYNYYPSYKGKLRSNHSISALWRYRDQFSKDDIKYLVSLYDSEIAFTDEHIGKLINELKKQGMYDNSVIIITADHGEEFMERGWIGHSITLHQELIRVPLIMKFPGLEARKINTPVSLIDIMPTICSYLGIQIPNGLDGQAINIKTGSSMIKRPVFSETFNPQVHREGPIEPIAFRSVVLGNMKLIYDEKKNLAFIYDLSKDPYEQYNLADAKQEEHVKLKALLSEWINYVEKKRIKGPQQDVNDLFTPEQREQLKSMGYL